MRKARFYHWWVYRLFHWLWGPLLRDNGNYRQCMMDSLLAYEQERGRYKSVDEMVATLSPHFYAYHWKAPKERRDAAKEAAE